MEFAYSDKVKTLQEKVGAFMDKHIHPNEERYRREVESGDRWEPVAVMEELKDLGQGRGPVEPVPAGRAWRGPHQPRICAAL